MEAVLPKMARVSQERPWVSQETPWVFREWPWMSRSGGASVGASPPRDTLGEAPTLAPPHRDTHGYSWVIHGHSQNTHGVSWDTHGLSWDTLAILGSTASTPPPLGVGVPMVRPQHKPHHPGTPLSHTGTLGSGEGDHPPLGALAAAAVPKGPAASNGHNFVVRAPILSSDHSIGIYSLRRCRWTPHLLHLSKYPLSYAPPKSRDSRASLLGVCCPSPQHSHCWALSLGSAPFKTP